MLSSETVGSLNGRDLIFYSADPEESIEIHGICLLSEFNWLMYLAACRRFNVLPTMVTYAQSSETTEAVVAFRKEPIAAYTFVCAAYPQPKVVQMGADSELVVQTANPTLRDGIFFGSPLRASVLFARKFGRNWEKSREKAYRRADRKNASRWAWNLFVKRLRNAASIKMIGRDSTGSYYYGLRAGVGSLKNKGDMPDLRETACHALQENNVVEQRLTGSPFLFFISPGKPNAFVRINGIENGFPTGVCATFGQNVLTLQFFGEGHWNEKVHYHEENTPFYEMYLGILRALQMNLPTSK